MYVKTFWALPHTCSISPNIWLAFNSAQLFAGHFDSSLDMSGKKVGFTSIFNFTEKMRTSNIVSFQSLDVWTNFRNVLLYRPIWYRKKLVFSVLPLPAVQGKFKFSLWRNLNLFCWRQWMVQYFTPEN